MQSKPIYVEIPIDSEMDKLWDSTQRPELHQQWDLRFSSITYLPKTDDDAQDFSYKTNLAFGLSIEGWGTTAGTHNSTYGSRTSSLHFGTDQAYSIIKEGKGYWKYAPGETLTFLTQYDYQVNFGRIGQLFDRSLFRPLIGWATALSFDVLKRWLEKGETPASQYLRFFSTFLLSFTFFFVWTYQGLLPKLIGLHPEEVAMTQALLPLPEDHATSAVILIGIFEILFGLLWLFYQKKRHLFGIQLILFPLLTISAFVADPAVLIDPFNPLTFNISLLVLSIIGFLFSKDTPTSKSCKRKR